jgi:hypothetical protein
MMPPCRHFAIIYWFFSDAISLVIFSPPPLPRLFSPPLFTADFAAATPPFSRRLQLPLFRFHVLPLLSAYFSLMIFSLFAFTLSRRQCHYWFSAIFADAIDGFRRHAASHAPRHAAISLLSFLRLSPLLFPPFAITPLLPLIVRTR